MPIRPHPASQSKRTNGWTPQRKHLFLTMLAGHHTVAAACARVGLSRQAAYKARRRDADFAEQWREAQASAYREAEQTFLDSLPDRLRHALSDERECELRGARFSSQDFVNSVSLV
jgi:hypothetical protein